MDKSLKNRRLITTSLRALPAGATLALALFFSHPCYAFETYTSGCTTCHGDFTGPTSPQGTVFPSDNKHTMHRSSSHMDTECALCHTDIGDDPFLGSSAGTANNPGLGCSGCHAGAGLRAHHAVNGIATCYTAECHDAAEPTPENVNPPYYGTVDTNADNACNDVFASKINENWSVGDFLGLDNDGDNLYDLADFDCGPPYRIVELEMVGNDVHISWETVGGRKDVLQVTSTLVTNFTDAGGIITNSGIGFVTNVTVEAGGVTPSNRFYRIRSEP